MQESKGSDAKITKTGVKRFDTEGEKDVQPTVVILGVGFAGLWAARTLANKPVKVRVIDRNNYHTFFPLLYQVGAAELAPIDIVYPVRHIFRHIPNIRFSLGRVDSIDFTKRIIHSQGEDIAYDYLIFGLGSRAFYFGIPGADEYAFPLKSIDQAIALRNQILYCFEQAARESNPQLRRRWLTFAIVGGGPTGVEFAGALSELINHSIQKDYPHMDVQESRILLIEAADHLLTGFAPSLESYARARLEKMGVEVLLNDQVVVIGQHQVRLKNGQVIEASTLVWTAGVRGFPGAADWGLPTARNGQVEVLPTLQPPGHPEVYVVGDLARIMQDGQPLPMVAQVAIQSGQSAARNILRQIQGKELKPFHYRDKGMLAVIGRNAAVAQVWGRRFTGFVAWFIWLTVHIFYLIGFRNRLLVLLNWAWDYFAAERSVDLIIPSITENSRTQPVTPATGQKQAKEPLEQKTGEPTSSE